MSSSLRVLRRLASSSSITAARQAILSSSSSTSSSRRLVRYLGSTARHASSSGSNSQEQSIEEILPHLKRPSDEELEAEANSPDDQQEESHMKDGLAIKMATSSFAGRRR